MRNGRGVKTSPTLFKERDMKKLLTEDRVAGKKTYFQT